MPGSPWQGLVTDPCLLAVVEVLIGAPVGHMSGLLFERGTQQDLHVDTWYGLAGRKPGSMVGVWYALDDADEDNGPLLYVTGSHRGSGEHISNLTVRNKR